MEFLAHHFGFHPVVCAYIENSILSTEAFYTLMLTAFFLNIAVPVTICLWKPVYQRHSPECMDYQSKINEGAEPRAARS